MDFKKEFLKLLKEYEADYNVFLEYWKGYERTAIQRSKKYKNIDEFRKFKS